MSEPCRTSLRPAARSRRFVAVAMAAASFCFLPVGTTSTARAELSAPVLVNDFESGPDDTLPYQFCSTLRGLLFVAKPISAQYATQLYFTNGTPESSYVFPPIFDGRYTYGFGNFAGCAEEAPRVYFTSEEANPGQGGGLWSTNGTVEGTRFLSRDRYALDSPGSWDVLPATQTLIWVHYDDDGAPSVVATSGIPGDIRTLVPANGTLTGFGDFFVHQGLVYFTSQGASGNVDFWHSDGTIAGTDRFGPGLADTSAFALPWTPTSEGRFYLLLHPQIRRLALLTWQGELRTLREFTLPALVSWPYAEVGGKRYFFDEFSHEIWKTDGTIAGTQILGSIDRVPGFFLRTVGSSVYFPQEDPGHGVELWGIDSHSDIPLPFGDLCPGPCSSNPEVIPVRGGALLYGVFNEGGLISLRWMHSNGLLDPPYSPACSPEPCGDWAVPVGELDDLVLLLRPRGGVNSALWSLDPATADLHPLTDFDVRDVQIAPSGTGTYRDTFLFWRRTSELGFEPWRVVASCRDRDDNLCFADGRIRASVRWRDFSGREERAHSAPSTQASGYFWFFEPGNLELALKLVNGSTLNGHFWLFFGALSNVEYWIELEDTELGSVREYHNALGEFGSFGDIEALPAPASKALDSTPTAAPRITALGGSGCSPTPTRACVLEGRFAVEATWEDFEGRTGTANVENLSSDTAALSFFGPNFTELLVKLVDGSSFNGHYWVYYGSLSNVSFHIVVTDTATGTSRPYGNPLGTFGSFGDIEAFPAP